MEALYGQFSAHTLCEALDVPRGTFYNHIFRNKRGNILAAKRREELKVQIQKIYDDSKQIYGTGKITAILRNQGIKTSAKYVSQIMRELGISSVSTTAKKEYQKWKKGRTEIFCNNNFAQTGQIKFELVILLFLSLVISIIISALSLIC